MILRTWYIANVQENSSPKTSLFHTAPLATLFGRQHCDALGECNKTVVLHRPFWTLVTVYRALHVCMCTYGLKDGLVIRRQHLRRQHSTRSPERWLASSCTHACIVVLVDEFISCLFVIARKDLWSRPSFGHNHFISHVRACHRRFCRHGNIFFRLTGTRPGSIFSSKKRNLTRSYRGTHEQK